MQAGLFASYCDLFIIYSKAIQNCSNFTKNSRRFYSDLYSMNPLNQSLFKCNFSNAPAISRFLFR